MKCPMCQKNEAVVHRVYGVVACDSCNEKSKRVKRGIEWTTDSVRAQRREYAKDILTPFRGDILSKEWVDTYGTNGLELTKQQVNKAQNVWGDVAGSDNLSKSKGGR